jgi:hypothetical protein
MVKRMSLKYNRNSIPLVELKAAPSLTLTGGYLINFPVDLSRQLYTKTLYTKQLFRIYTIFKNVLVKLVDNVLQKRLRIFIFSRIKVW